MAMKSVFQHQMAYCALDTKQCLQLAEQTLCLGNFQFGKEPPKLDLRGSVHDNWLLLFIES